MAIKFLKNKKIIIGALHLGPLLGYKEFPGKKVILKNALADLKAFIQGGVDAVIYENNYDLPHTEFLATEQIVNMTYFGQAIKSVTKKPLGVSVLWNDYRAALALASTLDLQFIRIPVFVDTVETNYGVIRGDVKQVISTVKKMHAESVQLFTDIHVKHAKLLSKFSLVDSARRAIRAGSSGIILTGKWTGDAPDIVELKSLRKTIGDFPILLGSGVNAQNAQDLFKYASGAIVSTALKYDSKQNHKINIKPYDTRISIDKVKQFMKSF